MKRIVPALILIGALLLIPATNPNLNAAKRPTLTSFCTNLTTPNQPPLGHPFNLTFTCPSTPAFTAQQTTPSIPTYSLPAGYSALYITGPTTLRLTSGSTINLPAGNYQYLAQYDGSPVATLASFAITWSS